MYISLFLWHLQKTQMSGKFRMNKLAGRSAEMSFETGDEIGDIAKTRHESDFTDRILIFTYQCCGVYEFHYPDIFTGIFI